MMDYLAKAFGAWFLGFFPLAEIVVAVPAAAATGLDDVSVVVWTVAGNFTPALLINVAYERLRRWERVGRYLDRLATDKVRARVNRWGMPFVLLMTPWVGIWAMSVTAKALGMAPRRFLLTAFCSILGYAITFMLLIRLGLDSLS